MTISVVAALKSEISSWLVFWDGLIGNLQFGCLLEQASALLLRMHNIYANVQLVEGGMERDTFQP